MQQLTDFIRKNWILIVSVLALLVVLQWCHQRPDFLYQDKSGYNSEYYQAEPELQNEQPETSPPREENNNSPGANPWFSYLLMVGLVLLVFVAQRRGWFEKIIPGMVMVRTSLKRNPNTKRRMLHIYFMNTTKTGQTFDSPVVEFLKPGSVKSYRINVNNNNYSFPITLTNNTSHKIVIDLDQFYEKVEELKKYRLVRVKVMINGMREKKTIPKLVL